jgi:DNA polymerase
MSGKTRFSAEQPLNIRRAAAQTLESLYAAGVTHVARAAAIPRVEAGAAAPSPQGPTTSSASAGPTASAREAMPVAALTAAQPPADCSLAATGKSNLSSTLEVLRREVIACQRCRELAQTRTQTVFGVGNPAARLVFIGEAPGADEDRQGEPFVGRAGQLLTKIIEACRLKRDDVYILNVLKCRPPGNRTPLPDEVENCRPFLEGQLAAIRPEFICCLGAVATRAVLELNAPMSRLRGKFYNYGDSTVICTYHPSYLLRNPAAKKDVWEDMKLLMRRMGVVL